MNNLQFTIVTVNIFLTVTKLCCYINVLLLVTLTKRFAILVYFMVSSSLHVLHIFLRV